MVPSSPLTAPARRRPESDRSAVRLDRVLTKRVPPDLHVPRHAREGRGQASGLKNPSLGRVPALGNTLGDGMVSAMVTWVNTREGRSRRLHDWLVARDEERPVCRSASIQETTIRGERRSNSRTHELWPHPKTHECWPNGQNSCGSPLSVASRAEKNPAPPSTRRSSRASPGSSPRARSRAMLCR